MSSLVLVRHARPERSPTLAAAGWPLSRDGVAEAEALREHPALVDVRCFFTSPEAKAVGTARILAGHRPVEAVPGLGELDRSAVGWLLGESAYRELVFDILSHPSQSVRGCESADRAGQRFMRAVAGVLRAAGGRQVALVSHGIVLTIYLSGLLGLANPDAALWESIGMPDLAVVDPAAERLLLPFAGATGSSAHP